MIILFNYEFKFGSAGTLGLCGLSYLRHVQKS